MTSPPSTPLERRLLILYATETGNAYDIAQHLRREAKRYHFDVVLSSVDEYPLVRLARLKTIQILTIRF